jgi:hypothetical protein
MFKQMLPAVAALALAASPAAAQMPAQPAGPSLSLVLKDGLVTLRAEQASLRQILAEWERQGQVKFVGIDKLASGAPITLSLTDTPEKQALEIVMRGVPGYMAVDRGARLEAQTASRFDRVVVMARAATPVAAGAAPSAGLNRAMPSPAQPADGFQQTMPEAFVQPVMAGDDPPTPDRADVEQFSQAEPTMPEGPAVSPYPNAFPGSPYVNGGNGPYGGNANASAAAGVNNAAPPETQFDYANPQKYFEQRRQQMQGPTAQPGLTPAVGNPNLQGTTGRPTVPTGVPTATGTLAQPGVAPTPQQQTPPQGQFFNPYNLPADWVPPPPVPDTGTPVEPDRAKYSNPYQPTPPQE